ncbi:MAG TPA: ORF6N domain-containing protein [Thermodesulfobacteriota bacterium]|nr:ORF6N domain-containing protein [Thermodesulfobacteriota bacterium]
MTDTKHAPKTLDDVRTLIHTLRGQRVVLDADLAVLYGVETGALNQAVKRNIERFPEDFMFQLSKDEHDNLISQTVISSWGGRRNLPYAFTEQGVAMLSSVLRSKRAIEVNIAIMRAFVQIRQLGAQYKELAALVEKIDKRSIRNSEDIEVVIRTLKEIMSPKAPTGKRRIGF